MGNGSWMTSQELVSSQHIIGNAYYVNGDKYEGEWKENKKNGEGIVL